MSFLGTTELKIEETTGEVRTHLRREAGLLEGIVSPLILAGLLFAGWWVANWWLLAVGGISIVTFVVNWIQGGGTSLRITSTELSIEGNQRNLFSTTLRVPLEEVSRIGWTPGGEGDDGGVYVQTDWWRHWGLPGVGQQDGWATLDAIKRQFPHLQVEFNEPLTLDDLLPGDGKLISLGLSENRKEH